MPDQWSKLKYRSCREDENELPLMSARKLCHGMRWSLVRHLQDGNLAPTGQPQDILQTA